jgi:hypothetical protein
MQTNTSAPRINSKYICIVDRESVVLAALISSYLYEPATYLPLFLFPPVKSSVVEEDLRFSNQYVSNLLGGTASTLINNAWARMGGRDYVILAGLSDHQKSFLHLPDQIQIIEIQKTEEVDNKLAPFAHGKNELRCKLADILTGLVRALKNGTKLVIDEHAPSCFEAPETNGGLVVVERKDDASPVIAINYARSVDAQILIVDSLAKYEGRQIQGWIQEWKEKGDETKLNKLKDIALKRIGNISFDQYEYATFFTEGVPYSFVIGNVIPCSHVNLSIRPDLFVLNNIIFESRKTFDSAVVFSPVFFEDEETQWLCNFFAENRFYVRPLIGRQATLANFDFHAQFFPYDFLHICSHGGEVEGYEMSDKFVDKDGNTHVVEFEEVVGYTPVPDKKGMVEVITKAFPRKLDGIAWMSEELTKQNFPDHVYTGMWDCILNCNGRRRKKDQVSMSCHIACIDSVHQGLFHTLASHTPPLVFNNACWSWFEVAVFFLDCGVRGYVGTLWDIENQDAITAAKVFYDHLFSETVLTAFHKAIKAVDGTKAKDIYFYWGLHFTEFSSGTDLGQSKERVRRELMISAVRWAEKIKYTKSAEIKRNSIKVLRNVLREIQSNFEGDDSKKLEKQLVVNISDTTRSTGGIPSDTSSITTQDSLDLPRKFRNTNERS